MSGSFRARVGDHRMQPVRTEPGSPPPPSENNEDSGSRQQPAHRRVDPSGAPPRRPAAETASDSRAPPNGTARAGSTRRRRPRMQRSVGRASQHSSQERHSPGPRRSASDKHGHHRQPDPRQDEQRFAGERHQWRERPELHARGASSLKRERRPAMTSHSKPAPGRTSAAATRRRARASASPANCRCSRLDSRYRSAPGIVSDRRILRQQRQRPRKVRRRATTPAFARSSACTRHSAAPSSAQSNGPSGSTQVPVVTPNTGEMFSSTAAHSPARASAIA